ncbi:MAG: T9SS type A sorting domain-containing protein, partial [Capnocytophaga sp.]|nr:T9SS type A sorting domain-containing protein [Capnocytophaga sp.]
NGGTNYNDLTLTAVLEITPEAVEKFNYYPNPLKNVLNIESPSDDYGYLYDSAGRLMMQFNIQKGNTQIAVSQLLKGYYMLLTKNGQKVKILKQ